MIYLNPRSSIESGGRVPKTGMYALSTLDGGYPYVPKLI